MSSSTRLCRTHGGWLPIDSDVPCADAQAHAVGAYLTRSNILERMQSNRRKVTPLRCSSYSVTTDDRDVVQCKRSQGPSNPFRPSLNVKPYNHHIPHYQKRNFTSNNRHLFSLGHIRFRVFISDCLTPTEVSLPIFCRTSQWSLHCCVVENRHQFSNRIVGYAPNLRW